MLKIVFSIIMVLLLASCKKDEPVPGHLNLSSRGFIVAGDSVSPWNTYITFIPPKYFQGTMDVDKYFNVSINSDTITDFVKTISLSHALGCGGSQWGTNAIVLKNNWQVVKDPASTSYAKIFLPGDTIRNGLMWSATHENVTLSAFQSVGGSVPNYPTSWYVNFNINHLYLGIRDVNTNDTTYGWLKVNVQSTATEYILSACFTK